MKKIIFLILLTYLSNVVISAQNFKVEYEVKRFTSILSDKSVTRSAEFEEKVREQEKNPEKYILYYLNGDSFFKSIPVPIIKHENAPVTTGETTTTIVEQSIKIPVKVLKKKGDDNYIQYNNNQGTEFYKDTKLKFKELSYKDETQMIDTFLCKLVELVNSSGSITKVWYMEDIPISAGPFSYGIFLGLVLKVESPTFMLYATDVSNTVQENDVEKLNPKIPVQN